MIKDFYEEAAGCTIVTGLSLAYHSFGDFLRPNAHFHGILLQGGFDNKGKFISIPIYDTRPITECFRRRVIRFFLDRELITKSFALNLLSWKNSGFSIYFGMKVEAYDDSKREGLAQYLARPPLSLDKIIYESFKGRVIFKTKYNIYFGENIKVFTPLDVLPGLD